MRNFLLKVTGRAVVNQGDESTQQITTKEQASAEPDWVVQQRARIEVSGLFDAAYYAEQNEDLAKDGLATLDHYVSEGGREGRIAHPLFHTHFYLSRYPDVQNADLNPLFHYLEYGGKEGRAPHPLFDPQYYLQQCPDPLVSQITPLEHFIKIGVNKGYDPNPLFSIAYYREQYSEKIAVDQNPLSHYWTEGERQGFNPHPSFFTEYYRAAHPDVSKTEISPLHHFLYHGNSELRDINPVFDARWYANTYGYHGMSWLLAEEHFRKVGLSSDANPSPAISTQRYCAVHAKKGVADEHGGNTNTIDGAMDPVKDLLGRFQAFRNTPDAGGLSPLRLWLRDLYQDLKHRERIGEHISVVIPCYNQGAWIEDAILSSYLATRRPLEIIVVDDGSVEQSTLDILARLKEQYPISLIRQDNRGLSAARNTGVRQARGTYVQFLDSDDLLLADKIDAQMDLGDSDVYLCEYFLCNHWCGGWRRPFPSTIKGFPFTQRSFLRNWERGLSIPIHCGLFRRSLLEGFQFDTALSAKEDWLMWISLFEKEPRVQFLDRAAVLYRQHSNNMGAESVRMGTSFLRAGFRAAMICHDDQIMEQALVHFTEHYIPRIGAEYACSSKEALHE